MTAITSWKALDTSNTCEILEDSFAKASLPERNFVMDGISRQHSRSAISQFGPLLYFEIIGPSGQQTIKPSLSPRNKSCSSTSSRCLNHTMRKMARVTVQAREE